MPNYIQQEFGSIVDKIDDKEAEKRHKKNLWRRWFTMYRLCKDPDKRLALLKQYNMIAREHE